MILIELCQDKGALAYHLGAFIAFFTDMNHRLDEIRAATNGKCTLVLHGTNTFPDDTTKKCIKGGMTRINVNELVLHKYNKYVAENTGKVPLTELMGKGTDLIQELIEYQMDVMGSTGKA